MNQALKRFYKFGTSKLLFLFKEKIQIFFILFNFLSGLEWWQNYLLLVVYFSKVLYNFLTIDKLSVLLFLFHRSLCFIVVKVGLSDIASLIPLTLYQLFLAYNICVDQTCFFLAVWIEFAVFFVLGKIKGIWTYVILKRLVKFVQNRIVLVCIRNYF